MVVALSGLMSLDNLRYGSFRPTSVHPEARALPGYGGQVEEWGTYRFMVEALEKKESQLSDTEKKKLGSLALRLTERLQGPALQIARGLGVDKLAEPTGVKVLLEALERDLLPLRRQAALELYQAGSVAGVLSRQHGEPMSSYCLRRETWWHQLQDMDHTLQVSTSIRGEQLLQHSGLGHLEMKMIRTVCNNDLSDLTKLCAALRDQCGTIHEKERGSKGFERRRGWNNHRGSGKGSYSTGYMADVSEEAPSPQSGGVSEEHYDDGSTEWSYVDEEWIDVEEDADVIGEGEEQLIEENVICWFAEQGVNAQTCSTEDMSMVYDAVDAEISAYYARGQVSQRGFSAPVGTSNYVPTGNLSPQDRQAKVLAAKQRTTCRACGQQGHWQNDAICPRRRSKGSKGWKGKGKSKGKGFGGKKGRDKGSDGGNSPKPRVVYFSVGEAESKDENYAGMAIQEGDPGEVHGPEDNAGGAGDGGLPHGAGLRAMGLPEFEQEVHRLMRLPPAEVDRMFRQEVAFVPATSKAAPATPPSSMGHYAMQSQGAAPSTPERGHAGEREFQTPTSSPGVVARVQASTLMPDRPSPPHSTLSTPTVSTGAVGTCLHPNTTRRGTNAYVNMVSCKDCGAVLEKVKKDNTANDARMLVQTPDQCGHHRVNWKGSNGYQWKWTCEDCGRSEAVKKTPGAVRPIPGGVTGASSSSVAPSPSVIATPGLTGGSSDSEMLFDGIQDWTMYQALLNQAVTSHIGIYNTITRGEFLQMVNVVSLCYRSFGGQVVQQAIPPLPGRRWGAQEGSEGSRSLVSTPGTSRGTAGGGQTFTFGSHKGRTFVDVYENVPSYVDWTLDEAERGGGWCAGMRRWMQYCRNRRQDEGEGTVYMALGDDIIDVSDEEDREVDPDDVLLYLDSGCNATCHGEVWAKRYRKATGESPSWVHQGVGTLRGIGGGTKTTGVKEFYVGLETEEGSLVPGEIISTEIANSTAPLLLSITSQQALGLVVDFSNFTIYSKTLGMTFKAVKGRHNGLLGLRMLPGPSVTTGNMVPMALMAADDGEETPPWRQEGSASSSSRPGPYSSQGPSHRFYRSSTGVRPQPGVPGMTYEVSTVPYGGARPLRRSPLRVAIEDDAEEEEAQEDMEDADVEPEEDIEPGDSPLLEDLQKKDDRVEDDDDLPLVPWDEEVSVDADDYWTLGDNWLVRHHVQKRNYLYNPVGARLDLPVSRDRLKTIRRTNKTYEDGSREQVTDNWVEMMDDAENLEMFTRTYRRVRRFPMTPADYAMKRRVVENKDTGEVLADESREEMSDLDHCTRLIPGGATNLKVTWYYVPDQIEEKYWTGTTVFELKPLDEELRSEPCKWEPEDSKKVLTRGQKKQLRGEVGKMEYEDVAMWSTLLQAHPPLPRGWKLVFELFCGCALLTRMAQSYGYDTCRPLDVQNGWDVFRADHRTYAEEILENEKPYLLALGFTCGPWSPWQRMNKDVDYVNQQRQRWIPILKWIQQMAIKQMRRGGRVLLENPWMSEAWRTRELSTLEAMDAHEIDFYEVIRVDLCRFGLRDQENHLPHLKPTGLGTNSPGIKKEMAGKRCRKDHEHQHLEGSNCYGRRTTQAAKWTTCLCRTILRGVLRDLQSLVKVAFAGESVLEDIEEMPGSLDTVEGPEDLPLSRVGRGDALEKEVELHEGMDTLERETDPEAEKIRRREWLKINKQERIGIRRLHHMTSHASKPQLQRMLRYAGASPKVIGAVKHFRCGICERESEEKKPFPVKPPSPYTFNSTVGLDIFEVKDATGGRYQVLHAVCHGTTYQCGEVLGVAKGLPTSSHCLQAFLRFWCVWAGPPACLVVDRGLHNRGIFQSELEKSGVVFRYAATEAPWELGRTERHGGLLKGIMARTILAEQIAGQDGLQIVLVEALNTKNRLGNVGGFSPQQWVLGRHPKLEGWADDDVNEIPIVDEDPMSTFNRRAAIREAARLAWMQEDSQKRIRKAVLRQGGTEHQRYQTGDMVSFLRKRGGKPRWFGPARVLVQEGRNIWILHGGVPIIIADTMVRPACPEELLEHELLGKRTKGVKRFRGFGYEDVVRSHQLDTEQQQSYMDFRRNEKDDMEDDLAQEFRVPYATPGATAPTEAGGDDESPKRMRQLERGEDIPISPKSDRQELKPEDVPVVVDDEEDDGDGSQYSPSIGPEIPVPPAEPVLDLQRLLQNPNSLDVGPTRARSMRTMDEDVMNFLLPVLPGEERGDRSRSPHRGEERVVNHVVRKEFNCFMANRSGAKSKAKSRGAQELVYRKEGVEMQRKLDEARGREWANWIKYKATRQPTEKEVDVLLRKGYRAIPMRWVDIDKNSKLRVPGGPPVEEKLKSRLVMRGDLEEGNFRVDCPTSSQVGVHLILSFSACTGQALRSGDITSAFLQGAPIDRTLLMKVPHDGIPNVNGDGFAHPPGSYLIALMSIYGSRDAPRGFWLALRDDFFFSSLAERAITAVPVTALPYEAIVTSSAMPRFHQAETHNKRTQNQQQPNKKPTTQHQPHPNRKPST